MAKAAKRRTYHHGDLRRALVDAALERIAEAGLEHFTLRDLAARVGVAPSAPYRHFPDKEALLAEVARDCAARLGAAMDAAEAGIDDPIERFRRSGIAYVRFAVENPAHFRVLNLPSIAARAELNDGIADWMATQRKRLRAAQARGELARFPVEDLFLVGRAWTYGLSRLIVDAHEGFGGLSADEAEALAERVLAVLGLGLLPRLPPGRRGVGRERRAGVPPRRRAMAVCWRRQPGGHEPRRPPPRFAEHR